MEYNYTDFFKVSKSFMILFRDEELNRNYNYSGKDSIYVHPLLSYCILLWVFIHTYVTSSKVEAFSP